MKASSRRSTVSGISHLLLIIHDVSERVEAKRALTDSMRQLEDKELAKTRFLAAAGHDLRQPVAAANLFIDALKLTEPTSRQEAIIQRLDQSMSTFNGLLDALLNVSKLDAGMIVPEPAPIHVAELFNWLEHNFAPTAGEKQLRFRLYFPVREDFAVHSDVGLVKSVLMNLVSNAIRFTSKGSIMISARPRGNTVLFQVWDSGIGIAEDHLGRIFDEFYQVDNPQRDRTSGLGLGLSIAKRALSLLGGKIRCRSRLGHGSVFEFSLPLVSAVHTNQPSLTASAQAGVINETFAQGKRFILVEDDTLVAQAMINWLEGMGGDVICFHKAEDALRHAHVDHADYYIADYMLGGTLNGIQFLNLLRQKAGQADQGGSGDGRYILQFHPPRGGLRLARAAQADQHFQADLASQRAEHIATALASNRKCAVTGPTFPPASSRVLTSIPPSFPAIENHLDNLPSRLVIFATCPNTAQLHMQAIKSIDDSFDA